MAGRHDHAVRCGELFAVGGFENVRRVAREGLDGAGPDPVLYRWLGMAHAAEDEDDHDAEAERAYGAGLEPAPDDLGLLVSYRELCRRSDSWSHPGRAKRAAGELRERIAELAPPGSPQEARIEALMGLDGPGYWDETFGGGLAEREELSVEVAEALHEGAPVRPEPEHLRSAEITAALELLSGPRNAPLRLLFRHHLVVYVAVLPLVFLTNRALTGTGVVSYGLWGVWLWYLPVLAAEAKPKQARRLARDRVVAAIEERHARSGAPAAAGTSG